MIYIPEVQHSQHELDPIGQHRSTPSHQFELQKVEPCVIKKVLDIRPKALLTRDFISISKQSILENKLTNIKKNTKEIQSIILMKASTKYCLLNNKGQTNRRIRT